MFYGFDYCYSVGCYSAESMQPLGYLHYFYTRDDRDNWVSADPMIDGNCHRAEMDSRSAKRYLKNYARYASTPAFRSVFGSYADYERSYYIQHATMKSLVALYECEDFLRS